MNSLLHIDTVGNVTETTAAHRAPARPDTRLKLLPRFTPIDLAFALLFGIALRSVAVLGEALAAGGFTMPSLPLLDGQLSASAWLWWVAVPVLVSPFLEEWVFRGVLQPLLTLGFAAAQLPARAATALGVLVAAALFGAVHVILNAGPWPLVTGTLTFLVGLVCGALVALTGRLGPAIGVHFVFNLSGVAMLLIGTFG